MKDFYKEIDNALKDYEKFKSYLTHDIDWICNRIDWCYKWRHITKPQMEELADRIIKMMDESKF